MFGVICYWEGFVIETIDYLKDRYTEEQARFNCFENKCSKLLTTLTIVIGAVATIVSFTKDKLFQPTVELQWMQLILFLGAALCIVCAWGHALLALKIGNCHVLPKSRDVANYLNAVDDDSRKTHILNSYVDAIENLTAVIEKKSVNIEFAYQELIYSAWFFGVFSLITVILEMSK